MGRSGRMRTMAVTVVALMALVTLTATLSLVSARSQTAAAREAVTAALATLQAAPAEQPLVLEGVEPGPQDAAALQSLTLAYLEAIQERKWEAAWEMIHPATREGMQMQEWSLLQILEQYGDAEQYYYTDLMYLLGNLLVGGETELGEVVAQEMSGWAELHASNQVSGTLVMRRTDGGWGVDLEASRDLEAREAVERQLEPFQSDSDAPPGMLESMIYGGMGRTPMSLTELALAKRIGVQFAVDDIRVSGDRATVAVTATANFRIAVPLANGDRGWSIAWCREPALIGPDESFAEVVKGRLAGEGALAECQMNMKQLTLALLMYSQDYDERLPIADRWCASLWPYLRNRALYHCPADDAAFSYAYNYKLSRLPYDTVPMPSETIALYESEIGVGDAFDWPEYPGTSLPDPPRHGGQNVFGFADGHVCAVPPDACWPTEDSWRPNQLVPQYMTMEGEPGWPAGVEPPMDPGMMPPPPPPPEEPCEE